MWLTLEINVAAYVFVILGSSFCCVAPFSLCENRSTRRPAVAFVTSILDAVFFIYRIKKKNRIQISIEFKQRNSWSIHNYGINFSQTSDLKKNKWYRFKLVGFTTNTIFEHILNKKEIHSFIDHFHFSVTKCYLKAVLILSKYHLDLIQ